MSNHQRIPHPHTSSYLPWPSSDQGYPSCSSSGSTTATMYHQLRRSCIWTDRGDSYIPLPPTNLQGYISYNQLYCCVWNNNTESADFHKGFNCKKHKTWKVKTKTFWPSYVCIAFWVGFVTMSIQVNKQMWRIKVL